MAADRIPVCPSKSGFYTQGCMVTAFFSAFGQFTNARTVSIDGDENAIHETVKVSDARIDAKANTVVIQVTMPYRINRLSPPITASVTPKNGD